MYVLLLCGLAFAGKSTLAALLAAELPDAVVVSLDDLNARRGMAGGLGIPEQEWARTHSEALSLVERALAAGCSAIVDDTNCFRFLRDDYRAVGARHGAETVVVHVATSLDVALGRLRENAKTAKRAPVLEQVLRDLAHRFEPPGPDERVLSVPEGVAPEDWARSVFAPMARREARAFVRADARRSRGRAS